MILNLVCMKIRSRRRNRSAVFAGLEFQCRRIHAIAQTGRLGAIGENMTEMRIALAAERFSPLHTVTPVAFLNDFVRSFWLPKTGPTRVRVVFAFRVKQLVAATYATINTLDFIVAEFTRERRFRALFTGHMILLIR